MRSCSSSSRDARKARSSSVGRARALRGARFELGWIGVLLSGEPPEEAAPGVARIEPHCGASFVERPFLIAQLFERDCQIEVRNGVVRLERDRAPILRSGRIMVASACE